MDQSSLILTLHTDNQTVVEQLLRQLELASLQIVRSFDLKVARSAHVDCTCPNHGTDLCDCQLVVLLVYANEGVPATLVVHGYDGQTQIALVDTPEQRPDSQLVDTILQSILPVDEQGRKVARFRLKEESHAD